MPKQQRNSKHEHFISKHQYSGQQRQKRVRNMVITVISVVIVTIAGVVGWSVYNFQIRPYNQEAIRFNGVTLDMRYFINTLKLYYGNAPSGTSISEFADYGEQQIERNETIIQGSLALGVQIKSSDIGAIRTLSGSGYGILSMSYFRDEPNGRVWCGPCSGVSIMRHYRDYDGYSSFPSNNSLYDQLYNYMDADENGGTVYDTDYGYGIEVLADIYGYETFNEYLDSYITFGDYECVVNDINNDYPTALLIWSESHWIAIRGYIATIRAQTIIE